MIIAIVYVSGILIPVFIVMCYVIKCRRHRCLKWLVGITLFIEFALSLTCMILSFVASAKYSDRSSTIKKLDSAVQGCMDQYSDIPDNVLKEQVKKPDEDG